jgi:hypothetical protein
LSSRSYFAAKDLASSSLTSFFLGSTFLLTAAYVFSAKHHEQRSLAAEALSATIAGSKSLLLLLNFYLFS